MSCQPENVTGFVDGALDTALAAEIEAHLAACEHCRTQADGERALRSRLLGLLHPALPHDVEAAVHRRLSPRPRRVFWPAVLVPLAAVLVLALLAVRRSPNVVAWELARDHDHCYGFETLGLQVTSEDPETVMRWFEDDGMRMPVLSAEAAGHELVGARYCLMPDLSRAAHVFYKRGPQRPLSVFVIARVVDAPDTLHARGHMVRLLRVGGSTVGVVADRKEDLDAVARSFASTRAGLEPLRWPAFAPVAAAR
jgi:anti-sigma factor RsiW